MMSALNTNRLANLPHDPTQNGNSLFTMIHHKMDTRDLVLVEPLLHTREF
jgi:hypothetical protein